MSWGTITATAAVEDVGDKLAQAVDDYFGAEGWDQAANKAESRTDAHAAARAASTVAMIHAGDWPKAKVTMNGHSNPDHLTAEGWSEEFVTINVYAVRS